MKETTMKQSLKYWKRKWKGVQFVLVSLTGVCIFLLIPFLDVVYRSFTSVATGEMVFFENYKEILYNTAFILAMKNMAKFFLSGLPVLLIMSLVLAVAIHSLGNIGTYLKNIFLFPMAVPVVSVAIFWKLLFYQKGFFNAVLEVVGLSGKNWLNTEYAFAILVGSFLWKNLGYDILLWIAGLNMIPREIQEAAKVDGAGSIKRFFAITLPNLYQSAFIIILLSLINAFKVFREAYLVAGDYPHESMYLMQHLFNNWFRELSLDKMSAAAVINAIIIMIIVWGIKKVFLREEDFI